MAAAGILGWSSLDPAQLTRVHFVMRFSVAATATFIIAEAYGWFPSFLAPVLAGALLANLPSSLTAKTAGVLTLMMTVLASLSFMLPALFQQTPFILVGLIGIILFVGFAALAHGKGQLPVLLLLICFATIPIFTLIAPQQAGMLPKAYARGMALAVGGILVVQAIWVRPPKAAPAPATIDFASPMARAAVGTAIILPLMLVYLMFGITDALPVLITTTLLVSSFDPRRGAMQGVAMLIGNFVGGVIAIIAYYVLQVAPSLTMLALITFLISLAFAQRIERGGPAAAVALVTFNQALIILSLAILQGPANSGLWLTRLFQFALAVAFALAVMMLVWGRKQTTGD
jgi:hypothetical protein